MSYGYFSKYDREVVRVFQIREHHAKIVKLGRYDFDIVQVLPILNNPKNLDMSYERSRFLGLFWKEKKTEPKKYSTNANIWVLYLNQLKRSLPHPGLEPGTARSVGQGIIY